MKTIVYIDGFNLYYRALKNGSHKWLDIAALSDAAMLADCDIEAVNYYVARVSGRVDPDAPARQHAYLRALEAVPRVAITYGNFLVSKKWSGLVKPPQFRPECTLRATDNPEVAYVYKTEEKGSDVNLGAHLVRDAALGRFEMAGILTNDTDLAEPIRIVVEEFGLPVVLLTPTARPTATLARLATSVRHLDGYLGACQLPDPAIDKKGREVRKPTSW